MEEQYTSMFTEAERAARRAQRAATRKERKRRHRRQVLLRTIPFLVLALTLTGILSAWSSRSQAAPSTPGKTLEKAVPVFQSVRPLPNRAAPDYHSMVTNDTQHLGEALPSQYAVVIDRASGAVLAEKNAQARISPASMTKILTLLVAVEHLEDLDSPVTITREITDYVYSNGCSVVGFDVDETVSVRELLYGTILPSGADASLALASHVAGSHEAFVALMNEKLKDLGLSDSAHFTNCVGLYNEDHYCTVYDMAMILNAAMENDLCREILSSRTHQTPSTPQHPDGLLLSNWFLRKIEDHTPEGFSVVGAKTGFVAQSGSCAASMGKNSRGEEFLCVTGNAYSSWRAIYDHVELYQAHCT